MNTTAKLNNIQVLRAFAAITVAVFHTGFVLPHLRAFGSFGVDVFFVISGYIMARILDPASVSSSDFFFRRRILRIVPPYWFFTILLFLAAAHSPQLMKSTRATAADLLQSLFFIPFTKSNGLIQPLLFVGWSLNYEMFFYLALAIGLLLYKRRAVWLGAAIVLATMLASIPFAAHNVLARFYARDISIDFLLGILGYHLCRAISDSRARSWRLPALIVCFASALGLIATQAFFPHDIFPDSARFLTLGALSFLLVTSASLLSQAHWDTRLASLVLLGDASYMLYLIHPYCEYSLDRLFGAHYHWLKVGTASGTLIGVSFSILGAILLHLYAERPTVRFLNRNFGGKRKSIEFAAAAPENKWGGSSVATAVR